MPTPISAAIRFQPAPLASQRGNPGERSDLLRLSDASQAHSEVSTVEMLQNKKVAPISGGFKSFVCVKRSGEKVTE
jgi:hypothetical protein